MTSNRVFRNGPGGWDEWPAGGVIPGDRVTALAVDGDDRLWVGSNGGAARRSADGTWTPFFAPGDLPANTVLGLSVLADGRIVVGTEGGYSVVADDDATPVVTSAVFRVAGAGGAFVALGSSGVGDVELGREIGEHDARRVPGVEAADVVAAPDGAVWVAGDGGVARRARAVEQVVAFQGSSNLVIYDGRADSLVGRRGVDGGHQVWRYDHRTEEEDVLEPGFEVGATSSASFVGDDVWIVHKGAADGVPTVFAARFDADGVLQASLSAEAVDGGGDSATFGASGVGDVVWVAAGRAVYQVVDGELVGFSPDNSAMPNANDGSIQATVDGLWSPGVDRLLQLRRPDGAWAALETPWQRTDEYARTVAALGRWLFTTRAAHRSGDLTADGAPVFRDIGVDQEPDSQLGDRDAVGLAVSADYVYFSVENRTVARRARDGRWGGVVPLDRGTFVRNIGAGGGSVWLGARDGASLNRVSGFDSLVRAHPLNSNDVWGVFPDPDGQLGVRFSLDPDRNYDPTSVRDEAAVYDPGADVAPLSHRFDTTRVVFDADGDAWAATSHGLERGAVTFTEELRDGSALPSRDCRDVASDGVGALWVATAGGVARRLAGNFTSYTVATGDLRSNDALAVVVDGQARPWVGTRDGGVARWDGAGFVDQSDGLPSPRVNDLVIDGQGTVWAATHGGLARNVGDQSFELVRLSDDRQPPVFTVGALPDGRILAATRGRGLYLVGDGDQVTRYTVNEGLPSNDIRDLYVPPGEDPGAWLATAGGLARFVASPP